MPAASTSPEGRSKKGGIANQVAVARDGKESSAGGELRRSAEFRFGVQRVAQKAARSQRLPEAGEGNRQQQEQRRQAVRHVPGP